MIQQTLPMVAPVEAPNLTITQPNRAMRFQLLVDGNPVAKYEFSQCAGGPECTDVLDEPAWELLLEQVKAHPEVEIELGGEVCMLPYTLNWAVHVLFNAAVFNK